MSAEIKTNISLKRKRDPIFQAAEKDLLLNLVKAHYDIIDSKKTDAVSIRRKNQEWQKIAEDFNTNSNYVKRDWCVLKTLWENLKKRAKATLIAQKQDVFCTDDAPSKISKDPVIERIINLIRPNAEFVKNEFVSDVLFTTVEEVEDNSIDQDQTFSQDRSVDITNEQCAEQHEIAMRILVLQEEQEKEKLKQEKEKTKQELEKTQQQFQKTQQELLRSAILKEELRRLREK